MRFARADGSGAAARAAGKSSGWLDSRLQSQKPTLRYIESGKRSQASRFEEKRPAGLINSGVYVFRRRALARFPEKTPSSFEYDVFPSLLASGARIAAVPCDAPSSISD